MTIDAAQNNGSYSQSRPVSRRNSSGFAQMFEEAKKQTATASKAVAGTGITGDYVSSFEILQPTAADTHAKPQGFGARSTASQKDATIDKTSELYQKAQELESYLVKIMLSSMRTTLGKTGLTGKDSFAGKMYEDMMYEEMSRNMTKSAGFGLADQMYLQLKPSR